jgi:hypothetical protein
MSLMFALLLEVAAAAITGIPRWALAPTDAEIDTAFAAKSATVTQNAFIRLDCSLTRAGTLDACSVSGSFPPGEGFEDGALSLASKYLAAPSARHSPDYRAARSFGEWKAGDRVSLDFDFVVSRQALAAPRVDGPELKRTDIDLTLQDAALAARYYPERAQRMGVSGRAVVHCLIEANGSMRACWADEEAPEGWGFAKAAVEVAGLWRVSSLTKTGEPTAGRAFTSALNFRDPSLQMSK